MHVERPSVTIPEELTRRARLVATGADEWRIPPAADAATVILLREQGSRLEVFLQRRVGRMKFAPGMYVFPGGRVEESDVWIPWRGPVDEPFPIADGAEITATYRALTAAGARETWEEAGTILASTGDAGREMPVRDRPDSADADFEEWLLANGYQVVGETLPAWTHWITPEVESRRFDTRFLVARLPDGQDAVDRGMESDHSSWFTPGEALDRMRSGVMPMLPPTSDALAQLADFDTVASVLAEAAQRRPRPWLPRPVLTGRDRIDWVLVDAYTDAPVGTA